MPVDGAQEYVAVFLDFAGSIKLLVCTANGFYNGTANVCFLEALFCSFSVLAAFSLRGDDQTGHCTKSIVGGIGGGQESNTMVFCSIFNASKHSRCFYNCCCKLERYLK